MTTCGHGEEILPGPRSDITFYVGHGYRGAASPSRTPRTTTAGSPTPTPTASGATKNLEWLALYSCQVLRDEWNGLSYFDRWRDEFNGLHLVLGFRTNAYVRQIFFVKFGSKLVDHDLTVRSASDDTQPNGVVTRVVGVYGSGTSSANDHFWGHGSVSPTSAVT